MMNPGDNAKPPHLLLPPSPCSVILRLCLSGTEPGNIETPTILYCACRCLRSQIGHKIRLGGTSNAVRPVPLTLPRHSRPARHTAILDAPEVGHSGTDLVMNSMLMHWEALNGKGRPVCLPQTRYASGFNSSPSSESALLADVGLKRPE